jgi:DNA repair exonuclease SbcCD ATPase subunit
MALTVKDVSDLTRILTRFPEWRAEMRRIVLSDELLSLPEVMRELAAAQARTEAALARTDQRLEELAAAQARTEAALARTDQRLEELAAAQARTDARLEVLTQRVDALTQRMDALTQRMDTLTQRVDALTQRVDTLTQRMDALAQRMEELAAAQARTDARLEVLTQRMDALAQRMEELAAAQVRTERRMDAIQTDLGSLKGKVLERNYADKAPAIFGAWLRRVRVLLPGGLEPALEDKLADTLASEELQDLLRSDILLRGRPAGVPGLAEVYVAVEVSGVVDRGDLERAQRRAGLLRKAGLAVLPAVAGEELTEGVEALLEAVPVIVVTDGHSRGWERALTAAL